MPGIRALLETAVAAHRAGDMDRAAALYRVILVLLPTQPDALHMLGVVRLRRGDPAEAAALIGRAMTVLPGLGGAAHNRANALLALGHTDDAAIHLSAAVDTAPDDTGTRMALAALLHDHGRMHEAAFHLGRLAALTPADPGVLMGLSGALRGRGDGAPERWLRRLTVLKPDFIEAHINLAMLLLDERRYDEAAVPNVTAHALIRRSRRKSGSPFPLPPSLFPAALPRRRRNLAMGLAMGYGPGPLRPFVESFRAACPDDELVLFIDGMPSETIAYLHAAGVRLESAGLFRVIPFHFQTSRFFLYRAFLERLAVSGELASVGQVLLSDVSDVVFQSDPFAAALADPDLAGPETVAFFLEREGVPIGASLFNARGIEQGFGPAALADLADRPVTCSGVVLGTAAGIAGYLDRFEAMAADSLPRSHSFAVDQVIHNAMLHWGVLPGARAVPNHRLVATLGSEDAGTVQISPAGLILSGNGTACPVLHQYNRHPSLDGYLRNRYAAKESG